MDDIKVSVCIPVYNTQNYIQGTIESILNQTFKDFELIISDNNSTDKTVEKIKEFKDDRIKIIQNKINVGMVKNWNILLENSRGEYIQFVCADDILEKDCLERKVEVLNKNKDMSLVFSSTKIIDKNGKCLLVRKLGNKDKIFNGQKFGKKSFRCRNIYGEPSNVMFKRNISKEIGIFNEKLSYTPDWEYWIRLSKKGKVGYINQALSNFRIIPTSGTSYFLKNKKIMKNDDVIFIESVKNNYGKKINAYDIFIHKLIGTIILHIKTVFFKVINIKGVKK